MTQSRVHALISGRVQGVYFRQSTQDRAETLGLTGFVRNLPDGRVEVCFVGEVAAVKDALEFVEVGPPGAWVQDVEILPQSTEGAEVAQGGFLILPAPGQETR